MSKAVEPDQTNVEKNADTNAEETSDQ